MIIEDASELADYTNAVYLLDIGTTVRPYYAAGWHPEQPHLILDPMPTNVDEDGAPVMMADRDEQVDYGNWMLGPRRAYHVKIRQK